MIVGGGKLMLLVTLLMSFMELSLKVSLTSPLDKKPSPFLSMELKAACHWKMKFVFHQFGVLIIELIFISGTSGIEKT